MDEAAEQRLREQVKAELRRRMRALRRAMPQAACAARSAALCERLAQLPEVVHARVLIGYTAFRKEADAAAVLDEAAAAGKTVGLVRVEADGQLGLHAHREADALVENAHGILEPAASAPRIEPDAVDVILVPALAVDTRAQRIGYGGGYYDRLLPRLPRAFKIVLAYDFQLLAEMPDTPGDAPADCVVTDRRVLRVSAPGAND